MSTPLLNEKTFERIGFANEEEIASGQRAMTMRGTAEKAVLLTLIVAITTVAAFVGRWSPALLLPAVLGAFAVSIAIYFLPKYVKILAPLYCLAEGTTLGLVISVVKAYQQVALQAALCTLAVAFIMFAGYRIGVFSASQKMRALVSGALVGLLIFYLIEALLGLFGVFPVVLYSGPTGVLINVFVCALASYCFVIDFDNIKIGVECGAPKIMEWYCAFSLTVTIIWVYIEILRLLGRRRN